MLVFVDGLTGNLITCNGQESVSDDPEGNDFPWTPKPLSEKLKGTFLRGETEIVTEEAINGKVKGLYFSAHWVRINFLSFYFYVHWTIILQTF